MSVPVGEHRATSFSSWQSRRLAQGRDEQAVLESARVAEALGEHGLALDLVAALLKREVASGRTYVCGEVMRRALASLLINIDAASRESAALIARVMPAALKRLTPETRLRTLALQDLEPLDHTQEYEAAASCIIDGAPYEIVRNDLLEHFAATQALAREREIDWLVSQIELRYEPGEDGLGRLWSAAGARIASPPLFGELLSREATACAVVRLAVARDPDEVAAALADALATAQPVAAIGAATALGGDG